MLAGSFALDAIGAGLVSLDHPLFEAEGKSRPPPIFEVRTSTAS